MDEAGREDGPAGAGWREEGPDVGYPAPALLQELPALDRAQEVVACAGEPAEPEDEEVPARPRVRTSTKVVLVVGAWLLLTLFLVGRFSGGPVPEGSARLDQAATGDEEDEAAAEGEEASGEESSGDGSEELAVGELVAGGGTYGDGTAIAGADPVAGGAGGGAVYAGIPAEASAGVGGGGAVPGAAPGSPGSTAVAPGSGGGSTTTAPSAGGTTDTTAPSAGSGGSGPTTTTAAASRPAGASPAATIRISWNGTKFAYDTPMLTVPSGSVVRMVNDSDESHRWKIGKSDATIAPGASFDRTITKDVTFGCDRHAYMKGRITVT